MFKDKVVLITGGSGSWANEMTEQLLKMSVKEVKIYSRGEISQVKMQRKFNNDKLKFVIGDVRDLDAINRVCRDVDYIFHCAALKHVPICEEYPFEAIQTNILGTQNVIKAAINNRVTKVIDVSSDKAAHPTNLYGMTKAVGEKLIIQADGLSKTKFVCIRAGNVMGSNGSVIPHFIDQIKTKHRVEITHQDMTRYFLTLSEAISLLFTACESDISGANFVMKMPSCKIVDLMNVLIDHYGNGMTEVVTIGEKQGEKLDEVLVTRDESAYTYKYNDNYYVISYNKLELPKVDFIEYNSRQFLMNNNQIYEMLKAGGFVN